ncbi:MAG: acetate--CoA ligase family protein [Desulfobacterales bacterium]|jgi:succinyl-CoA synthetase beta subunit|nr:acetate--CoA ligase family protein [Desulfobacterales bacterium]
MNKIIKSALDRGQRALSEHQSKLFLAEYGIPTTVEFLVQSIDEAKAAAEKIGYPVALKACSADLIHKSESGVIELNLRSLSDVAAAYVRIMSAMPIGLEGVLVQEMIPGMRELVFGMSREPQFGPCIMLGLGGVMTEILNDVVVRVVPFDMAEAREMAEELRCRELLDDFRGERAVDMNAICRALTGLGEIGIAHPEIAEIDINPMKINSAGQIKAVDALVVLKGGNHAAH